MLVGTIYLYKRRRLFSNKISSVSHSWRQLLTIEHVSVCVCTVMLAHESYFFLCWRIWKANRKWAKRPKLKIQKC